MTVPISFQELSRQVAGQFLQSVVVVDDRAEFVGEVAEDAPGEQAAAVAPPSRSRRPSRKLVAPRTAQRIAEGLNAKSLADGFADNGLVCAILKPSISEELSERTVLVASRSDIVVLDWNIHGDGGVTTRELLGKMLRGVDNRNRLRLVAIYTGERDIRGIAKELRTELNALMPSPRIRKEGDFAMSKGAVRIVVFAKEGTLLPATDESGQQRIVKESDLPGRLVIEFASLAGGLVSNVALLALASLRQNTHRILGRLRPSLDPGYLWHRTVQTRPADAEDHLVSLVAAEVRSILDDESVGHAADIKAIELWLGRDGVTNYAPHFGEAHPRSISDVCKLLQYGTASRSAESLAISEQFGKMKSGKAISTSATVSAFAQSIAESTRSNEQLAELMSLRTQYNRPIPRLQLGTLLSRGRGIDRRYYLCLQPRCDSVRVDHSRAFPLLPLRKPEANKAFGFVIPARKGPSTRLVASNHPYDLQMVSFTPAAGDDSVVAVKNGQRFRFKSNKGHYDWVGELKEDHAQRIANDFSNHLGRVGLTESEWLRLWATKKG